MRDVRVGLAGDPAPANEQRTTAGGWTPHKESKERNALDRIRKAVGLGPMTDEEYERYR